jgi:hypothetical protein
MICTIQDILFFYTVIDSENFFMDPSSPLKVTLETASNPAPIHPRIPPPGTPNHVSFTKNHVSSRENDPEFDCFHDGDPLPEDHVYLGAFGRTISY